MYSTISSSARCLDLFVQVFQGLKANIGAEVAKKGARNEKLTKKSLEANSDAYAYAPMMARNGPSRSAKGKAKAYGPPTRASPRLAALRAQVATIPTLEAPVAPAVPTPPSTRRTARISVKYYSMKHSDSGGPSNVAPVDNNPIEVNSDFESELKPEHTIRNLVEMEEPKEDPEEDPEEEPEEGNQGDEKSDEIYFANYFELAPANSSNESCTGPPPANI
ncbi:hypothetical protein PIB30_085404 [Stylosanthes scabra]|uniref:Uncharacterized protein n=1 Tax=Stylosanthes scabra TaxID=79078 RepID=A0ABU6ZRL9_9FABA|nr:hypothetical protein [Stylosanthes scabra]